MRWLIILISATMLFSMEFKEFDSVIERVEPNNKKVFSYSKTLKEARSKVVNISTQKNIKVNSTPFSPFLDDPFFRQFFDSRGFNIPKERVERSLGSGVIISDDGYIVTNNHVIEGAEKITVTTAGSGIEYEGTIIGADPKSDLAVIKIKAKNLNPIAFFDSDQVEIGDVVFAIGNPFGVGETITSGIVSATNRTAVGIVEYEDFIQTDAAINPGNSGGALINSTGALIGINSAILTRSGASHGVGFSIPSNMVKQITKDLIEHGSVTRAWLGVVLSNLDENSQEFYGRKDGALIMDVEPNSPADKAGIRRGDLIIKIDNKLIKDISALKNTIGSTKPNSTVTIEIIRDKKQIALKAKLTPLNKENIANGDIFEYKGIQLENLTDEFRMQLRIPKEQGGVVIKQVADNSPAQKIGLQANDLIVQVESNEISDLGSFKKAVTRDGKKRIYFLRNGVIRMVVL